MRKNDSQPNNQYTHLPNSSFTSYSQLCHTVLADLGKSVRKKVSVNLILVLIFCSCTDEIPATRPTPSHFKTQFHFVSSSNRIMLKTYWGKEKKMYLLQFDNHSPTWVNEHVIKDNPSLRRARNVFFNTSTSDGSRIRGDVYICDTVSLGGVAFNDVLFYNIKDSARKAEGVIGDNIISNGVWKIDFVNNIVTFASSIDSLGKIAFESQILPSTFKDNYFVIEPVFSNGVKKKFAIDLGFNGSAILPVNDFKEITTERTFRNSTAYSTPGGSQVVNTLTSVDRALLTKDSVTILYSTNDKVTESLVGLSFFASFEFLVLDYINGKIYVSRWRRN